jgi:hypothetical protein
MEIKLKEITVEQLTADYEDNNEDGVRGFGGKLDIRPPYQREFIYKEKQRDAVITTVTKDFPLNVMYWAVRKDKTYEVIDGQQRTISLCRYINGDFAYKNLYFHNLKEDQKNQILKYKLMVYLCSGTDSEKLEWFRTINIAGEKLTDQELRNAVYAGKWVSDAKRYFSKTGCVASKIGNDYLTGSPIRQEYLETAIDWISEGKTEDYMAIHQHEDNAKKLWEYFEELMGWVSSSFTVKRPKFMKGVDWGPLFNKYKDTKLNPKKIEEETARLIADDEVEAKKGIYPFILTRDERHLCIRSFTDSMKQKVYEKQRGKCAECGKKFEIHEMEGDHIIPWSKGGKTTEENCHMLCMEDNRKKSGK